MTRLFAIGLMCVSAVATSVWCTQLALAGDTGGIKGKGAKSSTKMSATHNKFQQKGKGQQKKWLPANSK